MSFHDNLWEDGMKYLQARKRACSSLLKIYHGRKHIITISLDEMTPDKFNILEKLDTALVPWEKDLVEIIDVRSYGQSLVIKQSKRLTYVEPKRLTYVESKRLTYVEPKRLTYVEPKRLTYVEPKRLTYIEQKMITWKY